MIASVGIRGITGIAQILFRIFRDAGKSSILTRELNPQGPWENYIVSFQAIDFNVKAGTHIYTLTAENKVNGTRADIVGPISFSGLAVKTKNKSESKRLVLLCRAGFFVLPASVYSRLFR
nr:hypothetical protein [Paenibacillus larvae]